ncbi:unnamed protein product [Protopolystoma xenopodis]|uniref:Uncharacterized protein n=1 Tax=Protopolystoma xenopodis TaxID=117903 RepID=A0A448X440_9PLAT|nr:unnamed protein product [Protopolystoma xenopodis]
MAGADFDRAAYVEFTDQSSVIMVQHSNSAIVKPANNLINVDEIVKRTGSDSGIGPVATAAVGHVLGVLVPDQKGETEENPGIGVVHARDVESRALELVLDQNPAQESDILVPVVIEGIGKGFAPGMLIFLCFNPHPGFRSRGHKRSRRSRSKSARRKSRSRSKANHRSDRRDKEKERAVERPIKDKDRDRGKDRDKERDKRDQDKDREKDKGKREKDRDRDRDRDKERDRGREKDDKKNKSSSRQRSDKESSSRKSASSTDKSKAKNDEPSTEIQRPKKEDKDKIKVVVVVSNQAIDQDYHSVTKIDDQNSPTSESETNSCNADGEISFDADISHLQILKDEDKIEPDGHSNHSGSNGESKRLVVGVKLAGPEDMDIVSPKRPQNDVSSDTLNGTEHFQGSSSSEEIEN